MTSPPEPSATSAGGNSAVAVRWLGAALTLLSAVWVVATVVREAEQLGGAIDRPFLAGVGSATVAYALLLCLNAFAWWWLLAAYGSRPPLAVGMSLWARTQIGKYVPGNVFHYVGRQVLGRRHGLGHTALGVASALELLSFLLAASSLAVVGLGLRRSVGTGRLSLPLLAAVLVAMLLAWPIADALFRRLRQRPGWKALPPLPPFQGLRVVGLPFILHCLFLVGTGGLLFLLLRSGWPEAELPFGEVLWLYPLAWAAGTVTPGAPGGIGVREAVLVLELQGAIGEGRAAALAIALRTVTLLGDLLLSAVAWPVYARLAGSE